MIGTHLDITEQRRIQEALRTAREELELAVEGAGVAIWNINLETRAASVNERWAQNLGYTSSELAPITIETGERLTHPDDWARTAELFQRHVAGLTPRYEAEFRMHHKDGHWIYVLSRGRVSKRDNTGKPICVSGTYLDVSALKEAEETLRTLSEVVEQSPVLVVITTPEHVIEYVNKAFVEKSGYSLDEAIGRRPDFIKSDIHPQEFYDQLWQTLGRGAAWRGELCSRTQSGTLFWHSMVIAPIRNHRGR
jgi:PAS domain S-box-containing protein